MILPSKGLRIILRRKVSLFCLFGLVWFWFLETYSEEKSLASSCLPLSPEAGLRI